MQIEHSLSRNIFDAVCHTQNAYTNIQTYMLNFYNYYYTLYGYFLLSFHLADCVTDKRMNVSWIQYNV